MSEITLYHYACVHAAKRIQAAGGELRPTSVSWARIDKELTRHGLPVSGLHDAPPVLWLTTLDVPDRQALGLESSDRSKCDRTEFRFETIPIPMGTEVGRVVMPWATFAALYMPSRMWRVNLEHNRDPATWWVATVPVPSVECKVLQ